VTVNTAKHCLAIVELLLVFPTTLFMATLFVRNIQPAPYQPAETARWIVNWFSARPHIGLGVCLIALPLLAFLIGFSTMIRRWRIDAELRRATLMVVEVACAQSFHPYYHNGHPDGGRHLGHCRITYETD
jgi:hypothetical protein